MLCPLLSSLSRLLSPSICMREAYFWQWDPETQFLPCRYPAASLTPRSICLSPSPRLSPCLHPLPISLCYLSYPVQHPSSWLAVRHCAAPLPFPWTPLSPSYPSGPSWFWAISFSLCWECLYCCLQCELFSPRHAALPPSLRWLLMSLFNRPFFPCASSLRFSHHRSLSGRTLPSNLLQLCCFH